MRYVAILGPDGVTTQLGAAYGTLRVGAGYGLLSLRPLPGKGGEQYYATDVEILYEDNGTSWVILSGSGQDASQGTMNAKDLLRGVTNPSTASPGSSGWLVAPTGLGNITDNDDTTFSTPGTVTAQAPGGTFNAYGFLSYPQAEPDSVPVYTRMKVGVWISTGAATAQLYQVFDNGIFEPGSSGAIPKCGAVVFTTSSTTEVVVTLTFGISATTGDALGILSGWILSNAIQGSSANTTSAAGSTEGNGNWGLSLSPYTGTSGVASIKVYTLEIYGWAR